MIQRGSDNGPDPKTRKKVSAIMNNSQKCTKTLRVDLKLPDQPMPAREPSRTRSVKDGELLSAQVDERGEALSEATTKSHARLTVDASTGKLRSRGRQQKRSNRHRPERDGCEEGTMTVRELVAGLPFETLFEGVRKMRWRVFVDPRVERVMVVDESLAFVVPYAELSVDAARALSRAIEDVPARATFEVGDKLSLSGAELGCFAGALFCGANFLTEGS
jgi:hypothetical protein